MLIESKKYKNIIFSCLYFVSSINLNNFIKKTRPYFGAAKVQIKINMSKSALDFCITSIFPELFE